MVTDGNAATPRVSVVIPTWNRRDLVLTCLRSLRDQSFRDSEIIVVDDGSTDETAAAVTGEFPEVRLVRLARNSGFCVAVNRGIAEARCGLILLLNNDMTLDPEFVGRLVAAADASEAALFAPLVLWRDEPETIYSAGDLQRVNGRPESIGFRCRLEGFEFPDRIFGVSAGAALYRREVFERIGTLDERFVAYFEDADLSFRARLAGFEAMFVREAVAYHAGSASLTGRIWWRTRQCFRNHALLVLRDMPFGLLVKHAGAILAERIHQARRLFSAARNEFGAARAAFILAEAVLSILLQVPHALLTRGAIQRSRTVPLDQLEAWMSR